MTFRKTVSVLLCICMLAGCLPVFEASAAQEYKLTYRLTDADGVTGSYYQIYEAGQTISPISYNIEGQTFSGWKIGKNEDSEAIPAVMPSYDLTVYGTLSYICYNITFVLTEGSFAGTGEKSVTVSMRFGTVIDDPPAVTVPEGSAFSGWTNEMNQPLDIVTCDMTYYGKVTQNSYSLVYMLNGEELTRQTYHCGDTVRYITDYDAETGYTFSGWKTEDGSRPLVMPADDVTVYGTRTLNKHKVTYVLNGIPLSDTTEIAYGEAVALLTKYNNVPGFTFSGWTMYDGSAVPVTMPDADITVYASMTAKNYHVIYILNDEVIKTETYAVGASIQYIDKYENIPGYEFSGWYTDKFSELPVTMPDLEKYGLTELRVYATYVSQAVVSFRVGTVENVPKGSTFDMYVTVDGPYVKSLSFSDIDYDRDSLFLTGTEWVWSEGIYTPTVDAEQGKGQLIFNLDTDCSGKNVLKLTFSVNKEAKVGYYPVSLTAGATFTASAGELGILTQVYAGSVQVICDSHNFKDGEIKTVGNGTHARYCANGCGVYVSEACTGGSATCQSKAVCAVCGSPYGFSVSHDFSGEAVSYKDGTHSYKCIYGCGTLSSRHVCTYGKAVSDGNESTHTLLCTQCGFSKQVACTGGMPTCQSKAVCAECGSVYGETLPHSYTGEPSSDGKGHHSCRCVNGCGEFGPQTECTYAYIPQNGGVHLKQCKVCGYTATESCSGGTATCLASPVCTYCDNAYGEKLVHSYTGNAVSGNDGTHRRLCINGCGLPGESTACTMGEWQSGGDNTHSRSCTVCGYTETENCSGGTKDCMNKAVCEICHTVYGDRLAHDYVGAVAPDGAGHHGKTCVNGCGKVNPYEYEDCTFGAWVGDGTGKHTKSCTVCGYTVTEDCTGGTASCTEKAVCTVCGTAYGETLPHRFLGDTTANEDGTHTGFCEDCKQNITEAHRFAYTPDVTGTHLRYCTVCAYSTTENCSGGTATCLQQAVCACCAASYGALLPHDYSGECRDNGDGTHSFRCVSGCEAFGDAVACEAGTYTSNGDGTHTVTCKDCGAKTTEACSGGQTTCTKKAVCVYCGGEYGDGGTHHFVYKYDKDGHWAECTGSGCTERTPSEPHTFSEWMILIAPTLTQSGERMHICLLCGYTEQSVLPRSYTKGDINQNGTIAAEDARLALRGAVRLDELNDFQEALADINEDGTVTAADARLILRGAVRLEDTAEWTPVYLDDEGNVIRFS